MWNTFAVGSNAHKKGNLRLMSSSRLWSTQKSKFRLYLHHSSALYRRQVSHCQTRISYYVKSKALQESVHPESGNFKGGYDKEKEKNLKKSAEKT